VPVSTTWFDHGWPMRQETLSATWEKQGDDRVRVK